LNHIFCFNW